MTQQQMAAAIPHEYRLKILKIWLPNAKVNIADENYLNLFNAYFIYIDPDGIKKTNCQACLQNVYNNWIKMQQALIEAEQEYYLIEEL